MAHDFVKQDLQLDNDQGAGRINLEIMATLAGGMLLITSFAAQLLYENDFYATILAFVSSILLGAPLIKTALKDLWEGHAHMNELVALAVLGAFVIQEYQEAAAIAFFMILSVLVENRTAQGAKASIESLIRITPTRARKVVGDQEQEVEARDLKPGDLVRVGPGDNIPADGQITRGNSTVNQANITGESLPVDKNIGDEVFGGTINLTGELEFTVAKAGGETTLGRVKDLILQAQSTRIPIARMIDAYATWYTPVILMLAFIVWFFVQRSGGENAMERVIAMLVIACPCALILATPTAMVAAISSASRLGVYVKDVKNLEAARNITAMVFDKTGTLTTGKLEVTKLRPAEGVEGAELLRTAASVEQSSSHPVAKAVVNVARKAKLTLTRSDAVNEHSGRGVEAQLAGERVLVGRAAWLTDAKTVELSDDARRQIEEAQSSPEAEGLSVLFVVRGTQLMGWVGLADNTRPEAAAAMDELREMGLKRLVIVTGDRESVAKRVAAQMHTEYKAEVLPHEKLEMVDALKEAGHRVAVIGDGVNDAPALAAGDISIAMGAAGSDVAIHSATIALMNNNLNRIPFVVELSRKTSAVIRQNLFIGIAFIFIFLGLAAANIITPIVAAVLHLGSGLVVVFNSARLVRTGENIEHDEARKLEAQQPCRHDHGEDEHHDHPHEPAPTPATA